MPPAKVLNVFSTKGCVPTGQPAGEKRSSLSPPREEVSVTRNNRLMEAALTKNLILLIIKGKQDVSPSVP
jgi:hypothetical protein